MTFSPVDLRPKIDIHENKLCVGRNIITTVLDKYT